MLKNKTEDKKDYYSKVVWCQITLSVLLLTALFLLRSDALKADYKRIMSHSIAKENFTALSVSVKDYLFNESAVKDVFASFFGANEETETIETTQSDAMGGDDIRVSQIPANCTFSPLILTSPILNPIENGRYTSYFGFRINPITKEYGFHTGLDIAACEGTIIRAALNGTVDRIGEDSRAGKYICLSHEDGLETFYCHCSEILAEEGANIRQGETIAFVGSTGMSTGPHVHFEVRKNNIRFDPYPLLENAD